jgi:alpha-L-rhamnosidase
MLFKKSLFFVFLNLLAGQLLAAMQPVKLTCEFKNDPLGIENTQPRLGWWIAKATPGTSQLAYQVQVAETARQLTRGKADAWDSEKVTSELNSSVPYRGGWYRHTSITGAYGSGTRRVKCL